MKVAAEVVVTQGMSVIFWKSTVTYPTVRQLIEFGMFGSGRYLGTERVAAKVVVKVAVNNTTLESRVNSLDLSRLHHPK